MAGAINMDQKLPGYRWVVLCLWSFCAVNGFMVVNALGILLPSIRTEFGLSPDQQGLLGSTGFWAGLALTIPVSWWASRYGPKVLTAVSLGMAALFLLLQGWAPSFAVLLVGRMAFGVSLVLREPARALLIQQWFPRREIMIANSISNVFFGVVVGGGLLVTPFLLGILDNDWRMTIYIFGALFAVLTVLWLVLGKERISAEYLRKEVPREEGLLRGALSYRDLWVAGFGFLGANMSWSAFVNFFPTLMLDTYGVSLQWSGAILALDIILGGVAGMGIGYAAMAEHRRKWILLVLGVLMAGSYVGMTQTSSLTLLLVFAFLNGIAWGFWPVLHSVPFQLPGIRPRETAVAMGFIMVMISVGFVLGPLVAGFLQEALGELKHALFVLSFLALSLSVAGVALRRPTAELAVEPSVIGPGAKGRQAYEG